MLNCYTVKIRTLHGWPVKTLKLVSEDGYIPEKDIRFFILVDGTRIEVPAGHCIFTFTADRQRIIENRSKASQA